MKKWRQILFVACNVFLLFATVIARAEDRHGFDQDTPGLQAGAGAAIAAAGLGGAAYAAKKAQELKPKLVFEEKQGETLKEYLDSWRKELGEYQEGQFRLMDQGLETDSAYEFKTKLYGGEIRWYQGGLKESHHTAAELARKLHHARSMTVLGAAGGVAGLALALPDLDRLLRNSPSIAIPGFSPAVLTSRARKNPDSAPGVERSPAGEPPRAEDVR